MWYDYNDGNLQSFWAIFKQHNVRIFAQLQLYNSNSQKMELEIYIQRECIHNCIDSWNRSEWISDGGVWSIWIFEIIFELMWKDSPISIKENHKIRWNHRNVEISSQNSQPISNSCVKKEYRFDRICPCLWIWSVFNPIYSLDLRDDISLFPLQFHSNRSFVLRIFLKEIKWKITYSTM